MIYSINDCTSLIFDICRLFQLLECQEYLLDLEKSLENPSQSDRVRLLGGKDPNEDELQRKMEEVSYLFY